MRPAPNLTAPWAQELPSMTLQDLNKAAAWKFIILVGVVSLFSDMTYEGARSISGPFLGTLKASALVVGVVAGLGEFLGYALRLGSGYLADRLGRYWLITFAGYALNLLAVPFLALAGSWEIAAVLLLLERIGKAIRTPARDAMLSHAAAAVGRGWGFGFHEAMDQIGAVTGPLIVAAVLYYRGGYREGFAVLLLPAVLALVVIAMAARLYPHPQHLEVSAPEAQNRRVHPPLLALCRGRGVAGRRLCRLSLDRLSFRQNGAAACRLDPVILCRRHGGGCRGRPHPGPSL